MPRRYMERQGEYVYTIKQVSAVLGMPAVTIRAWENRYGAVNPLRTESGYRMYTPEDVEDLRWLKEKVEQNGTSISQAVRELKLGKQAFAKADSFPPLEPKGSDEALQQLSGQIYETLFKFQTEEANKLIDYGFSIYGYDAMFYNVLVPVLFRVGEAWECGQASVAQEHFMTGLITRRFLQFFHIFPVHSFLPKALSFCPEGEYHQVGLVLFSLLLRRNGMDVIFLGANTPVDGILEIINEQGIDIVCMSITDQRSVPKADEVVRLISSNSPKMRFLLGGQGYEGEMKTAYPDFILREPPFKWQDWMDCFIGQERLKHF